ncbi:MAG: hypothetical protein NTY37_08685 [Methanothrix sp.]|nr:hypothetical protein [Methanothrix sp.]
MGSSARQQLTRAESLPRLPAALVAAAIGPGRPGLRHCCQGGLDCLASDRARGQEARAGLTIRNVVDVNVVG